MKLSILIPTYNYGAVIECTLKGMQPHTFTDRKTLLLDVATIGRTQGRLNHLEITGKVFIRNLIMTRQSIKRSVGKYV